MKNLSSKTLWGTFNPMCQLRVKVDSFFFRFVVMDVVYSIQEHRIYWSAGKDLMTLKINENKITKIASFDKYLYDCCLDWVARNLYITYRDFDNSYIGKFDLTMWENGIIKFDEIFKAKFIHDDLIIINEYLNISPSTGYVYYRLPEKIIFH